MGESCLTLAEGIVPFVALACDLDSAKGSIELVYVDCINAHSRNVPCRSANRWGLAPLIDCAKLGRVTIRDNYYDVMMMLRVMAIAAG